MTDLNKLLDIINKEIKYFDSLRDEEDNLPEHYEGRCLEALYIKHKIEALQNEYIENIDEV